MHLSSRSNRLLSFVPSFFLARPALAAASTSGPEAEDRGLWSIPDFVWDSCQELGWGRVGIPLLLVAAITLILLWPLARLMAGRRNILVKTTSFLGHVIVLSAAFLALGAFVARSESIILLALWAAAGIAILLFETRHIFEVSRVGATAIFGTFLVLVGVALYATELLHGPTPWTDFLTKSHSERARIFAACETKDAPQNSVTESSEPLPAERTTIAESAPPEPAPTSTQTAPAPAVTPAAPLPPQRPGPDLQLLYAQLQKSRAELDMKDTAAVARFNEQVAAYRHEKALAAAVAVPPAVPVKANTRRAE